MDILDRDDHGEAYVTVDAQNMEAVPMLMSADGSNGQVTGSWLVKWEKPGGITSNGGWHLGEYDINENGTKEEINKKISDICDNSAMNSLKQAHPNCIFKN